MLVVSGDRNLSPWRGRVIDLRVEDDAEPLVELRRLLTVNKAYNLMNQGDEQMMLGDIEGAVQSYGSAEAMVPDSHEMVFWHAATLAGAGQVDEALPLFARAFDAWPKWREVVERLPAADLLPDDPELIAKILAVE